MKKRSMVSRDTVVNSKSALEILIRMIFYIKQISKPEFNQLWERYFKRLYPNNIDGTKLINNRNMMTKRLCSDTTSPLTWNKFFDLIYGVLGYTVVDLKITIKNRTTEELEEYSISDVEDIDTLIKEFQERKNKLNDKQSDSTNITVG